MGQSSAWVAALVLAGIQLGCAAVPAPAPAGPLAPERYQHAADPDPAVRAKAAEELVADPSTQAIDLLLALGQHDVDPAVRVRAIEAVADRRDPSFLDPLERSAYGDPDPAVRSSALSARDRLWRRSRDPHVAAAWSLLCPGCGRLYLHDYAAGAAELGAGAALIATGLALSDTGGLDGPSRSPGAAVGLVLASAGQDLWFYSIFDAYRAARVLRDDAGYRHPITRETLPELASAPFRPSVLARPWVWGGVPLALAVALGVSYAVDSGDNGRPSIFGIHGINILGHDFRSRAAAFAAGEGYYGVLFDPVGIGEEALFRGYLQTELEDRLGTYGGLAAASAIFGAFHIANFLGPGQDAKQAAYAVPVIATLGAGLGLAYVRTGHRLETSVAMHFWYDFLLSTAAFAADPQNQPFVVQYGSTM